MSHGVRVEPVCESSAHDGPLSAIPWPLRKQAADQEEAAEAERKLAEFKASEAKREEEDADAEVAAVAAAAAAAMSAAVSGKPAPPVPQPRAKRPWKLPPVEIPGRSPPPLPGSEVLVHRTLEEGAKTSEGWTDVYRAMLKQAEMDSAAFEEVLAQRENAFLDELTAIREAAIENVRVARETAKAAAERVAALEEALQAAALAHAAERARARSEAEDRAREAVQARRDEWAERTAKEIKADREEADAGMAAVGAKARARFAFSIPHSRAPRTVGNSVSFAAWEMVLSSELDSIRLKLPGKQVEELRGVLRARQEAQRRAIEAHRLAAAGMALQSALDSGAPFRTELAGVVEAAKGDALVEAAAAPLRALAEKGVVPREQLQGLFRDGLADEARRAALVPAGAGGVLSYALARAAAVLRVLEPRPEHAGSSMSGALREEVCVVSHLTRGCFNRRSGPICVVQLLTGGCPRCRAGIEAAVARAGALVTEGRFAEAADLVAKATEGTAAAAVVAPWVKAVRDRATAEQALKVLKAQIVVLSVSID